MWGNLGQIEESFYRFKEAEFCFEQGLKHSANDQERGFNYLNYAAMLVQKGDWGRALPMCRKAYAYKQGPKQQANLGISLLALGQWKEGWPLYDAIIGFDQSRKKMQYRDEPTWDGTKGQSVIVYEEQGIGDIISFASMIPDLVRDSKYVIFDAHPKLEGLFRRSFPDVKVYGTATGIGEDWTGKHKWDASISVGALAKFYRPTPESCPGTPYLMADPDRVVMWRSLFRKDGRKVIGIAWSGGLEHTAQKYRTVGLDAFLPLFEAFPEAIFVSLQYRDASKEIADFCAKRKRVDLRQYRYGALTPDYDDTAAMISAMDVVVSVPTSIVHLAGALGVPCVAMKAPISCWKFNSGLPFHRHNMELIEHQGTLEEALAHPEETWKNTVEEAAKTVKRKLHA